MKPEEILIYASVFIFITVALLSLLNLVWSGIIKNKKFANLIFSVLLLETLIIVIAAIDYQFEKLKTIKNEMHIYKYTSNADIVYNHVIGLTYNNKDIVSAEYLHLDKLNEKRDIVVKSFKNKDGQGFTMNIYNSAKLVVKDSVVFKNSKKEIECINCRYETKGVRLFPKHD